MRKVIVSMNVTLDGFMAGPHCELDWHFQCWTEEMAEFASEQLSKADTILLGRVTYCAMASYWPLQAANPTYPRQDFAFADMMNQYRKVVFTKTLTRPEWNNSQLVKGNLIAEITNLKKQPGRNMIIYGSGAIAAVLTQYGMVDEYQLWVHPVILGKGKPFFRNVKNKVGLQLSHCKKFESGVVVLFYEVHKK